MKKGNPDAFWFTTCNGCGLEPDLCHCPPGETFRHRLIYWDGEASFREVAVVTVSSGGGS